MSTDSLNNEGFFYDRREPIRWEPRGGGSKEARKEEDISNIYEILKQRTENTISQPHFEMKPDSLWHVNSF